MRLTPITLRAARRFVAEHHRHSRPPHGWLFGVALEQDGDVIAVGIAGRPSARELQDGRTLEVTRVCTLGTPNACSRLYGALCRAGAALGYDLAVTYKLAREPGSSLAAAGFVRVAVLPARSEGWANGRPRYSADLFGDAIVDAEDRERWERALSIKVSG